MVLLVAAGIAAALLLVRHTDRDEFLRREAERVRARAIPTGARILSESPVKRTGFTAELSWQVETDTPWPEYARWARSQLASEFTEQHDERDNLLYFSKRLSGDTLYLRIERTSTGSPCRLLIVFGGRAD